MEVMNRYLYKVVASVACLIAIIFSITLVSGNMSEYSALSAELEELHNRAMTLGFQHEAEMFRVEAELLAFESSILPLSDRTNTILNLSRMFEEFGLIQTNFHVGELVAVEADLYRSSVIISGIGEYHLALDFIENVMAQEGIIQVRNLLLVMGYEPEYEVEYEVEHELEYYMPYNISRDSMLIDMEIVFYNHR